MTRTWRFILRGLVLLLYLGCGLCVAAFPLGTVLLAASPFLFLCGVPAWFDVPSQATGFWTGAGIASCVMGLAFLALVLWKRRGFCRFVCPMGTLQDGAGELRSCLRARSSTAAEKPSAEVPPERSEGPPRRVRGYHRFHFVAGLLAFYTLAAVWFGATAFVFLDPLVIFTAAVHGAGWALGLAGLVLLLSLFFPKFWCMAICPCGSVQEFLWRIPRLVMPSNHAAQVADSAEVPTPVSKVPTQERRGFLHVLASLVILAPCAYLLRGVHALTSRIRPPGVREEGRFLARCTRCGNCVAACPTRLLRPVPFSGSLEAAGTPEAVFEPIPEAGTEAEQETLPFCESSCTRCAQVCPTHAIPLLPPAERQRFRMARVEFDLTHCRIYEQHECRICERECPQHAISFVWSDDAYANVPCVDETLCTGCGRCRAFCPGVDGKCAFSMMPLEEE